MKKNPQPISVFCFIAVALIVIFWSIGFMWHFGPSTGSDSPWWAFPYYMTTGLLGFSLGIAIGGMAGYAVDLKMNDEE
jgi:hypothetical protein